MARGGLAVPYVRASNEGFLRPRVALSLIHQGMAGSPFNCAHGTSTVLSCAFCEQLKGDQPFTSFLPFFSTSKDVAEDALTARVQRGESATARCASNGAIKPRLHLHLFPSYNDKLQANPLAF